MTVRNAEGWAQGFRVWCWDLLSGWDPGPTLDGLLTLGELRQWGPIASSLHDEHGIVRPS